jgi:hypothetical protein
MVAPEGDGLAMDIKQRLQNMTVERILNLSVSDVAALFLGATLEIERLESLHTEACRIGISVEEMLKVLLSHLLDQRRSSSELAAKLADELTVLQLNAFKNNPTGEKNVGDQTVKSGPGNWIHRGAGLRGSGAPGGEPFDAAEECAGGGPVSGSGGRQSGEAETGNAARGVAATGVDPQDDRRFLAGDDDR